MIGSENWPLNGRIRVDRGLITSSVMMLTEGSGLIMAIELSRRKMTLKISRVSIGVAFFQLRHDLINDTVFSGQPY